MNDPQIINRIVEDSSVKAVDFYKMYADRAAAIRTIMILLVPVATATVSAVIAMRGNLARPVITGIFVGLAIAIIFIALLLRFQLNKLLDDYESQMTMEYVRKYKLLPLDSLMSAKKYQSQSDKDFTEGRLLTFANTVSGLSGLICTATVITLIFFLN